MRPLYIFEFIGYKPFKQYNLGPKFIFDKDYGNVIYFTLAGTDLLCMLNWGTQWTMVSYLKK